MSDGLSTTQVVERFGGEITYRQLDYWVRRGYVTPSVSEGRGHGNPRRWSEADVERVARLGWVAQLVRDAHDGTIWGMANEDGCPQLPQQVSA